MNAQNKDLITGVEFLAPALRLQYVPQLGQSFGIDNVRWKVLTDAIFPNATTVESILMALTYCKARNLDIFKRPVHIVPMWSTAERKMIDTIWPSIAELRTTAARTGQYAGKDETVFGPDKTAKVGAVEVTFPEWAQTTVYRMVQGVRCPFVGPKCYWLEYYAQAARDKKEPNDRWKRALHGQIEKCAEAGALRMAFPEEIGNEYAAEEMEGQVILGDVSDRTVAPKRVPPPAIPPAQIEANPATVETPPAPVEQREPTRRPPPAARTPQETQKAAVPTPPAADKPVSYADNAPAFFVRFAARCGEAKNYDALQEVWLSMIDPITDDMDSVDFEEAQGIMRENERRFEP